MGDVFRGFCEKFVLMQQHLQTLDDADVVLFVDAYDVLILANPETILNTFVQMQVPCVISVERTCWPDESVKDRYSPSPTSFRYINSGTYIGYVHHLKEIFNGFSPINPKDNDQTLMTLDYLNHPEKYTPDSFCQIFFPSCDVKSWEVEVDRKNRTLKNLETGSIPLVLHGNGYSPWYQYVYDSFFSDIYSRDKTPLAAKEDKQVFLAILAKNYADSIEKYLVTIDELMYDKKLITIYINASMSTDKTKDILDNWVENRGAEYAEIIVDTMGGTLSELPVTGWSQRWNQERFVIPREIRIKSLQRALETHADYYFALDCHSFITAFTLKELINKNKPIVAPMLRNIPEVFDVLSTFSSEDSEALYEYKKIGCELVSNVRATFLIQKQALQKLCDETLKSADIEHFVTNEKDFGVMLYFTKELSDDESYRLQTFLSCAMMWG